MSATDNNLWHTSEPPSKEKRPRCPFCHKVLRVEYNRPRGIKANSSQWLKKIVEKQMKDELTWRYIGYGHFDTMSCATSWANRKIDKENLELIKDKAHFLTR